MTKTRNIAKARGKLSALVASAFVYETLDLARAGRPVVRLEPITPAMPHRFGILNDDGWTDTTLFEVFEPEPEDTIDGPSFPG